ncbi:MAG: VCBS repeat-containing protein [Methylacidiphilales bacterium]|nr:VCBS repeat-containing protein [Candidatus Methylacidiphilales bacterium]
MERFNSSHHPYIAVDQQGNARVEPRADALTVDASGKINRDTQISPTLDAADLNGDTLPDLVAASSEGFLYYYANIGTKTEPRFDTPEIIPVWLQDTPPGLDRIPAVVNKIHLVDIDDDGRTDIVCGDYLGKIYYLTNSGTRTAPKFDQPNNPRDIEILTSKDGPWGNYFAPFLIDWDADGQKDLILGEGTYSANNIYFLRNRGTSTSPRFENLEDRITLIQGVGRMHLVPFILDWNADGKLDIVMGERDGTILIYLNESPSPQGPYKFKDPIPLTAGNMNRFYSYSRPSFRDLNGDGLPEMLLSMPNGRLQIAKNIGTPGNFQFEQPQDIKLTPSPPFFIPSRWETHLGVAWNTRQRRVPAFIRGVSNEEGTPHFDPDFSPPPESKGRRALKLEWLDLRNQKTFPGRFIMDKSDFMRIKYLEKFTLKPRTNYELTFAYRGDGIEWARMLVLGREVTVEKGRGGEDEYREEEFKFSEDFPVSSSWSTFKKRINFTKKTGDPSAPVNNFELFIEVNGNGYFYLDDVTLTERQ